MKLLKLLLLIIPLFIISCISEELPQYNISEKTPEYIIYNLKWNTSFEDNLLTVINLTTRDTIFKTTTQGEYNFDFKYNNKYKININQNVLSTNRKYTNIVLTNKTYNIVLDNVMTDECLRNWGFTLTAKKENL